MRVIFAQGLIKSPYMYAKSRFVPVSFAQGLIKSPMYAKYLIIACQVAEPFALLYKVNDLLPRKADRKMPSLN